MLQYRNLMLCECYIITPLLYKQEQGVGNRHPGEIAVPSCMGWARAWTVPPFRNAILEYHQRLRGLFIVTEASLAVFLATVPLSYSLHCRTSCRVFWPTLRTESVDRSQTFVIAFAFCPHAARVPCWRIAKLICRNRVLLGLLASLIHGSTTIFVLSFTRVWQLLSAVQCRLLLQQYFAHDNTGPSSPSRCVSP